MKKCPSQQHTLRRNEDVAWRRGIVTLYMTFALPITFFLQLLLFCIQLQSITLQLFWLSTIINYIFGDFPLGFIAPVVVKAKMLMQNIWRANEVNWDDNVPDHISNEWTKIYNDLPFLANFRAMRWLATRKKSKI